MRGAARRRRLQQRLVADKMVKDTVLHDETATQYMARKKHANAHAGGVGGADKHDTLDAQKGGFTQHSTHRGWVEWWWWTQ